MKKILDEAGVIFVNEIPVTRASVGESLAHNRRSPGSQGPREASANLGEKYRSEPTRNQQAAMCRRFFWKLRREDRSRVKSPRSKRSVEIALEQRFPDEIFGRVVEAAIFRAAMEVIEIEQHIPHIEVNEFYCRRHCLSFAKSQWKILRLNWLPDAAKPIVGLMFDGSDKNAVRRAIMVVP